MINANCQHTSYIEPTIISVQNDLNAMLDCKVIIGSTVHVVLCFSLAEKLHIGNYSC